MPISTNYSKCSQPLESDPSILIELMHSLGVSESFRFDDVLSLKEEPMSTVSAVIVVFPEVTEDEDRKRAEESERNHILRNDVQFLKRTIDNGMWSLRNPSLRLEHQCTQLT